MLAHRSGMIGLPLRLLAREVYDRVVKLKGMHDVSLITGEEKIVPKNARFHICTVEAMPLDISVACLVVDEIQLCADPERGHVFTDRLLHARGEEETMFLGSDTMRGVIQKFIPKAWFITRPRFSDLAYTGAKKLTRLPGAPPWSGSPPKMSMASPRSCAASAAAQRWCWAHSPRAPAMPRWRSISPAMWIFWSPPMPSAWASTWMSIMSPSPAMTIRRPRLSPPHPAETGQIAGRAGRYRNDGTFGVTGECEHSMRNSSTGSRPTATIR
jgi:ATP-dependent RNA helicase SUPV3L1/SUV3